MDDPTTPQEKAKELVQAVFRTAEQEARRIGGESLTARVVRDFQAPQRAPGKDEADRVNQLHEAFEWLARKLIGMLDPGRELSIALTELQSAYHWALRAAETKDWPEANG